MMTSKRLIVNADDYGRSPGISAGIRKAHLEGIVTTTTVMINLPGAREAIETAQVETPRLSLGVHLNLTCGRPLVALPKNASLTDEEGHFRAKNFFFLQPEKVVLSEVEDEWRTQIDRFLETGASLDHLDSHHHIALASPMMWSLFLQFALEHKCGVRLPNPTDIPDEVLLSVVLHDSVDFVRSHAAQMLTEFDIPHPDHFLSSFFAAGANLKQLIRILKSLPDGVSELMCHPGHLDAEMRPQSGYTKERERELQALTHPSVLQAVAEEGIKLTTFRQAWERL